MAGQLVDRCRMAVLSGVIVVLFLTSASVATASGIGLGVNDDLQGELLITERQLAPDTPKLITVEAQNPGSTSFTGRIRMDVTDEQNRTVFRTWSDTIQLTPGSLTSHRFMFYEPAADGSLTAAAVLHYGTERISRSIAFNSSTQSAEDGFSVKRVRTYDDAVQATVDAPEDVETFFVTVEGASTRRFAQQQVRNKNDAQSVTIPYHPEVLEDYEEDATLTVSSVDGKYHYTEDVVLTQETGFLAEVERWTHNLLGNLVFM